jgi:hypothetical protein
MNPLPSLLRASAWDAANVQMRENNRTAWNDDDSNLACQTLERLIRSCYTRPDDNQSEMCYIRFQIAEMWQKAGHIDLYSNWSEVMKAIETTITDG